MSDSACLHCAIHRAIADHFEEHGARNDVTGVPILDVRAVANALGQALGEILAGVPDPTRRGRVMEYVACVAGMATAHALHGADQAAPGSTTRCH